MAPILLVDTEGSIEFGLTTGSTKLYDIWKISG
jgi:hypothetical protein